MRLRHAETRPLLRRQCRYRQKNGVRKIRQTSPTLCDLFFCLPFSVYSSHLEVRNMNQPRNRLFFRNLLESIHHHVRGMNSSRTNWLSRKTATILIDANRFFGVIILLFQRSLSKVIKRTADIWVVLRRTQLVSLPLLLVGIASMTFLLTTRLAGPQDLMIGIRSCALGMLACSTLAYGFAVVFVSFEKARN